MIGVIFSVIAPVLVCTGVGLVWAKRGVAYEAQFITRLVTNVGFPCLIFSTLVRTKIDWSIFSTMGLAALGTTAAFGVIAAPALRLARLELRVFLPAMMFANTGNMGLPLCLLAFGEEGLALAISYFTISALLMFVFGTLSRMCSFFCVLLMILISIAAYVWQANSAMLVQSSVCLNVIIFFSLCVRRRVCLKLPQCY